MRNRLLSTLLTTLLLTPRAHAQQRDEALLAGLIQEWVRALVSRDTAVLNRIIADDYVVTAADGSVLTRAQDLEPVLSGRIVIQSATADSVRVRLFGNAGVVTGVGAFLVAAGDRPARLFRERFTEVFVRRGGRWQVVASASTALRPPASAASTNPAPTDSAAVAFVRAGIAAGNAEYIRAFGAADAAGVAAVYALDGARFGPNGTVLQGRTAIRDDLARFIGRVGPVLVTIDSRELWLVGDLAYESGSWSYTFTPPGASQRRLAGRYVTVWRRQPDGGWRIHADIGLPE